MSRWKTVATITSALCILQAGVLIGQSLTPTAIADELGNDSYLPGDRALMCRHFAIPVESTVAVESSDTTGEIGQWIEQQRDRPESWTIESMDFEVVQKATGYAKSYLNVCLSARVDTTARATAPAEPGTP